MNDLVAFLRARLDEDERVAREAMHGPDRPGAGVWIRECGHVGDEGESLPPGHDMCCVVEGDIHIYDEGGHSPEQAEHIAHWHPARVLAECDAKRRIVGECEDWIEIGEIPANATWSDEAAGAVVGRHVLRLLALPYAHHEDYDPAWAPEAEVASD